jgi:leucyl aminopeptidase (aminopeptidase T)
MGNGFKERKLSVLKAAYEEYKELASFCAGPAVVETFGEEEFSPVNKKTAFALNEHQEELTLALANESRRIVNQYMPGDETSFTIIAFPVPEIGRDFAEIFRETIRINTLDYEVYKGIQQHIIDALDEAQWVEVTGRGGNETSMRVMLHPLKDREKETNFENCVADVNIPLGEVFTSPLLTGTEGLLHVKQVYIEGYSFQDLRMKFEDGRVVDFSCGNFAGEEGRELVKQVIMRNHSWLPLGEFAIGTNTAAYAMAEKYHIGSKLPILIAEKTGPHFAVGDTCYSFAEDSPMYNPDGKEVIARDNEISLLRKEDASKAYFSCHTDITIPYSELGDITAVNGEKRTDIIRQGRFVLKGTEMLNEAFDNSTIS